MSVRHIQSIPVGQPCWIGTVGDLRLRELRRVTAVEKGPATWGRSVTRFSYPASTQTLVASTSWPSPLAGRGESAVSGAVEGRSRSALLWT